MPKEIPWVSEITKVENGRLVTRGVDQSQIIREFNYEEMIFLLLFGRRPTSVEACLLRAVIVSHCSHGLTGQSTIAVRMGADCRSPFLNSAFAGFLVGSGDYHQGALSHAMEMIGEAAETDDLEIYVSKRHESKSPIFGYGHRFHSKDPRAVTLMEICNENNFGGKWIQTARAIERITGPRYGKFMNIEAAGAAILLELGFTHEIASLIIVVGRLPMYAAAYLERLRSDSKPFQRLAVYDVIPGRKEKQ